jgi:hypothetical protein
MNTTNRILGESEPEFSEQFKDTLALFDPLERVMDSPGDVALDQAIQAYEAKYGNSTLTTDLGRACDDCSQHDLNDWAMELQADFIFNFVRAVKNGEIPVASLLHSVLSGHALEGDVDLAISAIGNRLGWDRADLSGFYEL